MLNPKIVELLVYNEAYRIEKMVCIVVLLEGITLQSSRVLEPLVKKWHLFLPFNEIVFQIVSVSCFFKKTCIHAFTLCSTTMNSECK